MPKLDRLTADVAADRRPDPDGALAGLPHDLRGDRRGDAAADADRRVAVDPPPGRRRPAAGARLGQAHRGHLRHRRGVRHGAVVRAGPALAALHGLRRAADRAGLRARGLRVLHRGDLPRPLSLRLGSAAAAPALVVRRRRGGQRRRLRDHGAGRQRLDAEPGRLHAVADRRADRRRRAGRCSPTRRGRRWPRTRRWRATRRSASRPPRTTPGRCGGSPTAGRYARLGPDDRDGGGDRRGDRHAAHRRPAGQARASATSRPSWRRPKRSSRRSAARRSRSAAGRTSSAARRATGSRSPARSASCPAAASTPRSSASIASRAISGRTSPVTHAGLPDHGRRRHDDARRRALVLAGALADARRGTPRRRCPACCWSRSSCAGRSASSRSRPAGWSPKSAGSRG